MNNSKTINNRKTHKENILPGKAKILKEINKITGKQLLLIPSGSQSDRVLLKRNVGEVKYDPGKTQIEKICKAFRSVASQTLLDAPNDYDGVVRFPSSRKIEAKPKREIGLQVENFSPRDYTFRRSSSLVDYVKMNQIPVIKPKMMPTTKKPDPCKAPPTYQRGIIPKYLQKLKEEEDLGKEELKKHKSFYTNAKIKDKDLEEKEEKLRKLSSWHNSYKQMVQELNMLSAS